MPPDLTDDGARAARTLRADHPELAIVLLSQHIETRHSVELVASAGSATCSRTGCSTWTTSSTRCAGSPRAARRWTPRWSRRLLAAAHRDDPLGRLTAREREVLALMAEGRTNVGIARRLWLHHRTVETHIGSIMSKLGLPATTTRTTGGCSRC